MRVDVDDETVSSLERILNSPPPPGRVLPLPVCLEELSESLRDPRPTWKGQRHSLLDDLNASVKDVGPKLRVATRASLDALTQSVTRALAPPEPDAVANRTTRTATEQLAEQLQRPAALHAAWQDLVTGLRNQLRTDTVLQRLRLLLAMATAAHHNSDQLRRDLHSIIAGHTLSGPPQAETDSGTTSAAERLAECQERIALPARSGHCVVWLTFSGTLANSTYEVAEPMAFFQSEWAVPNAQQEDGQDVPHRDELKRIEDRLWGAPCEPDVVLVRVDLGERPAAEALDDGWRQAALVVGRAALRARARPWKPLGWHALLLDEQGSVESFATEDQLGLLPNPHERRAVANALSEVAPSMAGGEVGRWLLVRL